MSATTDKDRPRTLRGKLTARFVESLEAQWAEHGDSILDGLRQDNPAKFAEIVARLCPQESHIAIAPDLPDTAHELEAILIENMASDIESAERMLRKARKLAKQQEAKRPPESEINRTARLAARERSAHLHRTLPACTTATD